MSTAWKTTPLLDRAAEYRRSAEGLAELWRRSTSRLLEVDARTGVAPTQPLGVSSATAEEYDPRCDVFLGLTAPTDDAGDAAADQVAWFARRGDVADGVTLRDGTFDGAETELVAAATAVLAWHDAAGFCERCGAATVMAHGGFQRHCTGCGRDLFPRTDPAMIVAVLDGDDQLLLAHQSSWPEGRVSILAGFLEAGESAEQAVVREVQEESGLVVDAVRYLASQPWPYPRSLMLGFVARAHGEVRVDGQEIAWARWYTAESLAEAEFEGLTLPGQGSIAGRIITAWREGRLPQPEGADCLS